MDTQNDDLKSTGFDTHPPMLDKTDFASWQQCIRFYCQGKDNGINILKSINEGPFVFSKTRDTVTEGVLGPERDKLVSELTAAENERYKADIRAINILLQGLPKDIYTLINHHTTAKVIWDNVQMILEGSEMTRYGRESQLYDDFEHFQQKKGELIYDYYFAGGTQLDTVITPIDDLLNNVTKTIALLSKSYKSHLPQINNHLRTASNTSNQATEIEEFKIGVQLQILVKIIRLSATTAIENGVVIDDEQLLFLVYSSGQAYDDRVDEEPVQDLAQNKDNIFQADHIDAFDSDIDEAPTAQTMFMANLTSTGPVYDESGSSYDSDILSEVHEYDIDLDTIGVHHEVQEIPNNVQLCYDVKNDADYMNESNMISYD
ncbi:hypothetical protein Tco_1044215 [Tanacetum coccineum]|uniref:Integrase, catalytic region, zinc finger, CCHC-type, peptidase aspartic, catalytic n=1 Tax=Tanacetum coccineum TaxID=301880 RepID=A0ABQ5GQH1_9ASTR